MRFGHSVLRYIKLVSDLTTTFPHFGISDMHSSWMGIDEMWIRCCCF